MDTAGSEMVTDISDSSNSAATSPAQNLPDVNAQDTFTGMKITATIDIEDSDSDVSMSAETDEDEETPNIIRVNPLPQIPGTPASLIPSGSLSELSKKRKHSSSMGLMANDHINGLSSTKRLKPDDDLGDQLTVEGRLPKDRSLLPAEIWHHIFTFTPPRALGLLLQVNKSFNAYLDPSSSGQNVHPLSNSAIKVLSSDAIWQASKRLYRPSVPYPINGHSELDMWKLACSDSCQFCGKKRRETPELDPWHSGPSVNGVIPVWQFEIRTCGPCLQQRTIKELDLLLSSMPSPLMIALPFVFLTNDLHVITTTALENAQTAPSSQHLTKVFLKVHVEEIKKEFSEVSLLGSAAAEEWFKGLDDRGKERKSDASRWERLELTGVIARMRSSEPHEMLKLVPQLRPTASSMRESDTLKTPLATNSAMVPLQIHPNSKINQFTGQVHPLPQPIHTSFSTNPPPRFDSPSQGGSSAFPRQYPQRHERTKEEVAELKAARRAEIERRCMLLNPPLTAGVLAHMPSFQAATQIIQPLDDGAWEVLKPRLLAQREEAEQRENDRIAQTRVVQERFDERRYQDMQLKPESKDIADREWDDIQAPLRARIGGYADEIIRDGWNDGEKISMDTSPKFAADVLIYVRKRFYAEVAKDEAAIRAAGLEPEVDPPNGPFTRKLILENMKWVFDTKIKPHTEQYRKELFLCSACDNNFKIYGFEGVIQHYAAKHTSALSVGSIVVHWKSEWPEYPPFNPDPSSVAHSGANSYYASVPSASAAYSNTGPSLVQSYNYPGYQSAPVSVPMQTQNPHVYQESPGPYYGHPQFGDQYSAPQNGPYAPPQPFPESAQVYQGTQYSVPPPSSYTEARQDYSLQGYAGAYPVSTQAYYNSSHLSSVYPSSVPDVGQQTTYDPQVDRHSQYGPPYNQPTYSINPSSQYTQPPQKTEEYMSQLRDVARDAREIWNSINGVKEIPGSVKVFTIIYHILKRSRASFQEDPPLTMIIDGLSNNKDMRPVRNINGLLCKACTLGMAGSSNSTQGKKHFSFPQLVNHFHSVHEEGVSQQSLRHVLDWTKDMVDLPDQIRLASLAKAPGMDDQRLKLFAEALPDIVSMPLPRIEDVQKGPVHPPEEVHYPDLAPSRDNHESYYTMADNKAPESPNGNYDDSQYDPRDPRGVRERVPVRDRSFYSTTRTAHDDTHTEYLERSEHIRADQGASSPPSQSIDYNRWIIREEAPQSVDKNHYTDNPSSRLDYRIDNSQSYLSNMQRFTPNIREPSRDVRFRPIDDSQTRTYEVAAQISQDAQQARGTKQRNGDPVEAGSEDGELLIEPSSKPTNGIVQSSNEATNAAERFLNNFHPEETHEIPAKRSNKESPREDGLRAGWEGDRGEDAKRIYQPPLARQRRFIEGYEHDDRIIPASKLSSEEREPNQDGYIMHKRVAQPRQAQSYAYEDRYMNDTSEQPVVRERSPELVDRRYKLNNVVYRETRESSQTAHRTQSRYARYESVRLENEGARSRSPVYVKIGPQHGQYREHSPSAHTLHQEPIYRTRTPQPPLEEVTYKPAPRQGYYRVYADEPRTRQPQYTEAFELVQVSDPAGDYMIRRPIHREPEPIYGTYDDAVYSRRPVYETRATATSRTDPAYFEEYDPRHPAALPAATVRKFRYQ
ncbi:hypothetical protein B7494_g6645 [Chlorociboria aeruginascens]|nr:hypothetical protein B7494_g6645 [Chlorociboria aeruginascens]